MGTPQPVSMAHHLLHHHSTSSVLGPHPPSHLLRAPAGGECRAATAGGGKPGAAAGAHGGGGTGAAGGCAESERGWAGVGLPGAGGDGTQLCALPAASLQPRHCTECAPRLPALRSPLLKTRTLRGCLLLPGTEQQPSQPLPLLGPRCCCPSPPLPGSTTLLLLQSWSSTPSLWSCKRSSWRSSSCCPSTAAGRQSWRGGSSTMKAALSLEHLATATSFATRTL